MEFMILTFFAIFLLIASGGALLFYREAALRRISEAINPRPKERKLKETVREAGASIGTIVERFENLMPKSEQEVSIMRQRLTRAGYRDESAIKFFYGTKVLMPLLLAAVALFSGLGSRSPFLIYVLALGGGFLAPDFWLGKKIEKRQKKIARGLPDVLDLLVICMEAGLSLDQATARTTHELKSSHPELSDELGVLVLEQRAGCARADSWKHLSARTGVESLRNLVSTLVQSEQFGTSVAKVLRVHADTLRQQRIQMVEELAAKTSVKLVFPLVLFIFPALFVVTLGPAAIIMMESFSSLNNH
jgi:tight adherence protein C